MHFHTFSNGVTVNLDNVNTVTFDENSGKAYLFYSGNTPNNTPAVPIDEFRKIAFRSEKELPTRNDIKNLTDTIYRLIGSIPSSIRLKM